MVLEGGAVDTLIESNVLCIPARIHSQLTMIRSSAVQVRVQMPSHNLESPELVKINMMVYG